jgi:hypothetical protein
MTIATYAELLTELPSWLDNRTTLTDRYPVFVALCEAKMNRRLRTRRQVARSTISPSAETLTVPTDFAAAKSMRLTGGSKWQLDAVSDEQLTDLMGGDDSSGEPQAFALEGGNFVFWPPPSSATSINLVYYQTVPGLEANSTNWVLTNHPDAYLYGAVAEAWSYLGENEEAAKFAQLFLAALDDIEAASISEMMSDRMTPQIRSSIA